MYLHGGDWQEIKTTLEIIGGPTTVKGIGTNESLLVEAITSAQALRPDRYTILSTGVTDRAIRSALHETSIV